MHPPDPPVEMTSELLSDCEQTINPTNLNRSSAMFQYTLEQFTLRFTRDSIRHSQLRHRKSQDPANGHYRSDYDRIYGRPCIEALDDYHACAADSTPVEQFADRSFELVSDSLLRSCYVTYEICTSNSQLVSKNLMAFTQPGQIFVFESIGKKQPVWNHVTDYCAHNQRFERASFRCAIRSKVLYFTAGACRLPHPEDRVRCPDRKSYMTNIQFVSELNFGFVAGRHQSSFIPTWLPI